MIEVGKVYVEIVEVTKSLSISRHWKVLHKVSDETCFCTNEEGRYEIKNPSKWKEGRDLAAREEMMKQIRIKYV